MELYLERNVLTLQTVSITEQFSEEIWKLRLDLLQDRTHS